ncbi:hypothetical protein L202_07125 [Cryptococcus amylolentus CBS 6039]|uniref:Major facilitator superfamily (MFS) profile domain-containing protein n=2 Tax=Cryptococcus amylolentus TaxID=104669 RepID=A0A1E3HEM5_9TREE|nr:hypothetical protein L202_07125 [Cryptococcus amylolentus CBS 6039]ODN74810.1 hypothetical protein L202_07125 [Cryptococcus amylolentus CBS 6039]ODO01722.1 hypothetical protein I350_06548 [Cryptococcus amylolentus CBS 6273]
MLPPPPTTRKSSYPYVPQRTVSRQPSTASLQPGHQRIPSMRSVAETALGLEHERRDSDVDEDAEDEQLRMEMAMDDEGAESQGGRGLEETLERVGFGAYHWRLLALCGFGWMSDNSALQCIAVILPRVQIHFNLSSQVVGLLSACTMAGMMIGAVSWGVISDILGRSLPFNSTLFLTGFFGVCASFSPNFTVLCIWMFWLGSAVGGSMPTDGTLFLENLPHSKQYLLTLLSVFFSLGAVLSSVISWYFLPGSSCQEFEGCDFSNHANDGWRKVLFSLGIFNLICALARWFLFKLQESPRYLVSTGRSQEAILALQTIADFNDHSISIQHADVQSNEPSAAEPSTRRPSFMGLGGEGGGAGEGGSPGAEQDYGGVGMGPERKGIPLQTATSFYKTPGTVDIEESRNLFDQSFHESISEENRALLNEGSEEPAMKRESASGGGGWTEKPRDWWMSWVGQMQKLFVPQWRKTVILMWIIWGSMSFAYTMFNVWLPAVLESRASGDGDDAITEALGDFVLYSVAGCPGSICGAWMIQTRLGRRKSLAICTLATGLSTFAFINVEQKWAVVVSSMVISAAATAMYAVLYGMTPETFGTNIRGTACGTSSALSRFTGVLAPVSAGFLITVSPSLPVFTSAAIFCMTAACSLALPFERVGGPSTGGFAH